MLLYADTLRHPPVWDDHVFVFGQEFLKDCGNLPRAISPANLFGVLEVRGAARPVWLASVLLDTCAGDGRIVVYRLSSVFWHALGAVLVMALAAQLVPGLAAGLAAGILFAVHPLHTEAVNIITFRSDLLCLAFMLLAVILYRDAFLFAGRRRGVRLLAAFASACLALLSKEMAVVLPLLLLLSDALFPFSGPASFARRRRWGGFAVCGLLVVFYLVFRAPRSGYVMADYQDVFSEWRGRWDIPFSKPLEGSASSVAVSVKMEAPPWRRAYGDARTRLLTMSEIFGSYLRLLAWPSSLQGDYAPEVVDSWRRPAVLASWGAWLFLFAAAWALRRRRPLVSFGIGWTAITLLPVSGIVTILNLQAERYLYVPSAGFCLAVAGLLAPLFRPRRLRPAAAAVLAVLAAAGAARSALRNRDYRSDEAFFRATLAADDRVPRAHLGLALVCGDSGRFDCAESEFREALRLWPRYLKARLSFADFLAQRGRVREAAAQLEEVRFRK